MPVIIDLIINFIIEEEEKMCWDGAIFPLKVKSTSTNKLLWFRYELNIEKWIIFNKIIGFINQTNERVKKDGIILVIWFEKLFID